MLGKLKMESLNSLDLFGNSLVNNEAVDGLLKLNLSKLQHIDIGGTSISSENAYRIITTLNTDNLRTLNLSKKSYKIRHKHIHRFIL